MGFCLDGVLWGWHSWALGSDSPLICIPVTSILEFWGKDINNGVCLPKLVEGPLKSCLLV